MASDRNEMGLGARPPQHADSMLPELLGQLEIAASLIHMPYTPNAVNTSIFSSRSGMSHGKFAMAQVLATQDG